MVSWTSWALYPGNILYSSLRRLIRLATSLDTQAVCAQVVPPFIDGPADDGLVQLVILAIVCTVKLYGAVHH